ncbi:MAG: hypothetical protein HRU23_19815 [Gammaproteobacteria bacterium]|nr:hypothetical protein [Gammaproteobacteria bacterium]
MSKKNSSNKLNIAQLGAKLSHFKLPELSSGGLLVFQSGSFGLRAALFKSDKDYASLKGFAQSRQIDFTRAIGEIYQQLKQQHGSLPKRCVLITPSVSATKVSLPVSPVKPKANSEMQELIRWEIESDSGEDTKQWLIGSMLVERGYLTNSQREELVTELEFRHDLGGDSALIRFGDLAVELGYLNDDQLQECFALQNKLIEIEQDTIFGYQGEVDESHYHGLSDSQLINNSDNQSDHQWLVAGIGSNIRNRWFGAFNLNGLKLEQLYPDNGVCFSALGLRSHDQYQCLLEIHASHLVYVSGSEKNLKTITIKARQDGNLTLDEVIAICPNNIIQHSEILYLYSPDDPIDDLSFTLAEHLNIEVRALVQAPPKFKLPKNFSSNKLLPFIGIANHFLGFAQRGRASSVRAKDKEQAFWKQLLQPKVMITATVGLVLCVAAGFISWMYYNLGVQQQRMVHLEKRWSTETRVKQQLNQVKNEYNQLGRKMTEVQDEIALNQKLYKYLSKELLPAASTVPGTLSAVASAINPGVLIEEIILEPNSIVINGRALKTSNANQFANQLNENLKPWRYQVGDTESIAADEKTADGVYLNYKMRLEIGRRYFIPENEKIAMSQTPTTTSARGVE